MKLSKTIATTAAAFAAATMASPTLATEFIPPSDPDGEVFTTNSNDGYDDGRGVVFAPTSDFSLFSVGIFQDLTGIDLSYSISVAPNSTGFVGGGPVISSGSLTATTDGLEWIDFSFAPLELSANTFYHLEFQFDGESNQNFFFDQRGAEPYDQPGFVGIDGTSNGSTNNFVIPFIRLNGGGMAAVPEPATWAMMLLGFFALGSMMRNKPARVQTRVRYT